MDNRIGIIGLGIMGGAFARNLAAGGWSVIGYDVEPRRNAEAKAAGVEIAHSAEAVAEAAADIITSLPTPRAVLDTAEVVARANVKGRTVVEASTLALRDKMAFKEVLEKAGHVALDCPMSGTGAQAAVKDLVVYASGDSAAIKRSRTRESRMLRSITVNSIAISGFTSAMARATDVLIASMLPRDLRM